MAVPFAAMLGRVAMAGAVGGRGASTGMMAAQLLSIGKAAKTAIDPLKGLASTITGTLMGPLKGVRDLFSEISGFVQLFNPAIVTRFTLALNDTMAVLGSALVPVLQGMTIYVQKFGDALAGLLPAIQPLFDAIGQMFASYAEGFAPIIEAATPFIALFAGAMADLIRQLSTGLAFFQGIVAELLDTLAEMFGIKGWGNFQKDASSKGFAARQTKVSNVEQFARDVFASSARNIYSRQGGGKKPEDLLADIKQAMDKGRELVQAIAAGVNSIWALIKEGIGYLVKLTPEGRAAWGQMEIELERERQLERRRIELEMRRRNVKPAG